MRLIAVGVILSMLILTACGAVYNINQSDFYLAHNTVRFSNNPSLNVEDFQYSPFLTGEVSSIFEVKNAGPSVHFDIALPVLIRKKNLAELEKSGILLADSAPITLSADIKVLYVDGLGFTSYVSYYYSVIYKLKDTQTGKVLFEKDCSPVPKQIKKMQGFDTVYYVNEIVEEAYLLLVKDERFQAILGE